MTGNDWKRPQTTENDMKEEGCLSVFVYRLITVSLLVLVTNANCVYECECVGLQTMLVLFTNTPYSGRHGEGPSRASIF